MRIYTKAGDLAFSTFTFPDGQPHFKLETYDIDFRSCTVETAIRTPTELFQTLLVAQTLRQHGYSEINLDVRYLMGARMDRAILSDQPFTLDIVARMINGAGFSRVRILDVHSEVSTRLIRNATNILPHNTVASVIQTLQPTVIVTPDTGATKRVMLLTFGHPQHQVQCSKKRDPNTGKLGAFEVDNPFRLDKARCLIIDDICDGGATFTGLSKVLREWGAIEVYLYVTHGIFSKGLPLEGVDKVFTTDSYCNYATGREFKNTVVLPISIKEL